MRLMHIGLLTKVMEVADTIGQGERVYGMMGEGTKAEGIGKEMRKLHRKGRQSNLLD